MEKDQIAQFNTINIYFTSPLPSETDSLFS